MECYRGEKKLGVHVWIFIQTPGGSWHSFAIGTNTTTTSSTLCNPYFSPPPAPYPLFSVPLLHLWAFQIDSDITLEVYSPSALDLLWAFHTLHRSRRCTGVKVTTKPKSHSFSMQTICYALCIRCAPILADSLIFRWDTVIAWLHWQMFFPFLRTFCATPVVTLL
jgi:hypothetical protein